MPLRTIICGSQDRRLGMRPRDLIGKIGSKKVKSDIIRRIIMENHQLSGYGMMITGLVMILVNALSYLFDWDLKSPAFTVLGLVLVAIGAKTARKSC